MISKLLTNYTTSLLINFRSEPIPQLGHTWDRNLKNHLSTGKGRNKVVNLAEHLSRTMFCNFISQLRPKKSIMC